MPIINRFGYLERRTAGSSKKGERHFKDWWGVRDYVYRKRGFIDLYRVYFPKKFIGKRVKIKVEVLNDNNKR